MTNKEKAIATYNAIQERKKLKKAKAEKEALSVEINRVMNCSLNRKSKSSGKRYSR